LLSRKGIAMTLASLPPDLGQFVHDQVSAGRYRSEDEVVVDAVRLLRELQCRQQRFEEDIRLGIEDLQRGDYVEYDEEGLGGLFEELGLRARNRCGDKGGI
jgi:putative addiction module CopG family antidote